MTALLTEETTVPTKKSVPITKDGHVTPRRIISIHDELWGPAQELAKLRHMNASAIVREALREYIAEARANGELPKRRRSA